MAVLISTNMYTAKEFQRVLPYVKEFSGQVGVEVFPMFHKPGFEEGLKDSLEVLSEVPVSFHGPYYQAEHSARPGSETAAWTEALMKKTVKYARILRSRYVVFHHNNCRLLPEERAERIAISCENYRILSEKLEQAKLVLAVENAGVKERGNMLFDEEEFVERCLLERYPVVLDIGHAYANDWDLKQVMKKLKKQIIGYHLHNNDGLHDLHQRIHKGTLDFDDFLAEAKRLTPDADLVLEYAADVADDEAGIREDVRFLLEKER